MSLAELAAFCKEDVSDTADEIIADYLDEQEELDKEHQGRFETGFCLICGQQDCACLEMLTSPALVLMKPPK